MLSNASTSTSADKLIGVMCINMKTVSDIRLRHGFGRTAGQSERGFPSLPARGRIR